MKPKVKLLIPGHKPREVYFETDETLAQIAFRLGTQQWPLYDINQWWRGNKKIGPNNTFLEDGGVYAGTPRIGAPRTSTTNSIKVLLTGQAPRTFRYRVGETMASFLLRINRKSDFRTRWAHRWRVLPRPGGLYAKVADPHRYILSGSMQQIIGTSSLDNCDQAWVQQDRTPGDKHVGTVRLCLVGQPLRNIPFRQGESVAQLAIRLHSRELKLKSVRRWYVSRQGGGQFVEPNDVPLCDGMIVCGELDVDHTCTANPTPFSWVKRAEAARQSVGFVTLVIDDEKVGTRYPFYEGETFWGFLHNLTSSQLPPCKDFRYEGVLVDPQDDPLLQDKALIIAYTR